jgi:hypothetical protein
MIALVLLMSEFANARLTDLTAWVATALVVSPNVILLLEAARILGVGRSYSVRDRLHLASLSLRKGRFRDHR